MTEIYGIRDSGKYGALKQVYNEMYQIYSQESIAGQLYPNKVVVEDSNAGFKFFESICSCNGLDCIAAGGKSKIFGLLCNMEKDNLLVIADGAAFGCEMEKVMALVNENTGIHLYLPESFEWLLLNSEVIKDKTLKNILEDTADYVVSEEYNSWERFFTDLLVKMTQGTYLAYTKSTLNQAYLQGNIPEKVLQKIKGISFQNRG